MTQPLTHTIFMLVKTTKAWLAMNPPARFAFLGDVVVPILKAHPAVKLRFFDAEGFNARVTDVAVWETTDLSAYQKLVDRLRETPFWDGYFEIVEIVPAVENGYAATYGVAPIGA